MIKLTEATTGGVLQEKVFLRILQNSQENTCARVSFFIKMQAWTCNFIKKETLAQVFSSEFCKTFKYTFFKEHPGRLLLNLTMYILTIPF